MMIVTFLWFVAISIFIGCNCEVTIRSISTKRFENTVLEDDEPVQSVEVENETFCLAACLTEGKCQSMNIKKSSNPLICELLEGNAYMNQSLLKTDESTLHLSVLSVFCDVEGRCKNGGTCVPDYSTDGGSCLCTSDYIGERCEENNPLRLTAIEFSPYSGSSSATIFREKNVFNEPAAETHCLDTLIEVAGDGSNVFYIVGYFTPNITGTYIFKIDCGFKCRLYMAAPKMKDTRIMAAKGGGNTGFTTETEKLDLNAGKMYYTMIIFLSKSATVGVDVTMKIIGLHDDFVNMNPFATVYDL